MKKIALAVAAAGLAAASPAMAELPHLYVTGSLVLPGENTGNLFPSGPVGTATSATEFGATYGATTFSADFFQNQLFISEDGTAASPAAIFSFVSSVPGYFRDAQLIKNIYGGTFTVIGDTLTYNVPANSPSFRLGATFAFNGTPAATPEAGTWALLMVGMAVVGAGLRRGTRRERSTVIA